MNTFLVEYRFTIELHHYYSFFKSMPKWVSEAPRCAWGMERHTTYGDLILQVYHG